MKNLLTTIVKVFSRVIILSILIVIAFNLGGKLVTFYQYQDIISALDQAKNHAYTDKYQCMDFSKDLSEKLTKLGVANSIEIVQTEKTGEYHAVVSLQIDPQKGEIVNYKTIDNCNLDGDNLSCNKGNIQNHNMYVASR